MHTLALSLFWEGAWACCGCIAVQNLFTVVVFHWGQIHVLLRLLLRHDAVLVLGGGAAIANNDRLVPWQMVSAAGHLRHVGNGVQTILIL